jgi:hypothetical protein
MSNRASNRKRADPAAAKKRAAAQKFKQLRKARDTGKPTPRRMRETQ